ncbi:hypothetical protein ACSBR2_008103 [Camellia fascicularis]
MTMLDCSTAGIASDSITVLDNTGHMIWRAEIHSPIHGSGSVTPLGLVQGREAKKRPPGKVGVVGKLTPKDNEYRCLKY